MPGTRFPFGMLLRELRLAAGLSQELLAERARISAETIGALERGARKAPQRETLALICDALALSAGRRARLEAAAAASRPLGRPRANGSEPHAAPHNLPYATNSFHGRERELADLGELLRNRRIVTLHGTGGAGKTRLACEVARAQLDGPLFPDGAWFVDLATVNDPAAVAGAVARTLSVCETPFEPVIETLVAALGRRRLMLIFDNCEHLTDTCARTVEQLAARCASVTVLATSREPLNVAGELLYPVDPLPLPGPDDGLECSPSARLFVDRAADADPRAFARAAAEPAVVARICTRLDGLPLALELAAARTRDLSLHEILTGLDARFALLSHGRRTALPRQQTLRGMIDWSYGLLAERDRYVFRRLGIFAGSWTAEAAIAVCSDGGAGAPAPDAVRRSITALVSASLIVVERRDPAAVRYRLLESMRSYACTLLRETGEHGIAARRHAEYYRDCAVRAASRWRTGLASTANAAFETVVADLHEVRAALDWAIGEREDVVLGAELTGILADLWAESGFHHEGLRRIEAAEAALGDDAAPALIAPLEFGTARMLERFQLPGALEAARSAAALSPSGGADAVADWIGAFRTRIAYPAGHVIFRKDDVAEELYYVVSGTVVLEELGVRIGAHDLLGEVAFFSPTKRRTATAICATDVVVSCIGQSDMLELYQQQPAFRLYVVQVFAKRMIQDLERLASRAP